ncbi:DUF4652 domain-containing protein [Ectobacillus polymachus]|uniref:DUF4652 domain-containing protein n=1 Tax=Ectobacillus polymachus TaxID=1508806 RepID=UPI003A844361
MLTLRYENSTGFIYVVNANGVEQLLENRFSSEPNISSNGKRAIYVTPLEWEDSSHLILFDLELGIREEINLEIDVLNDMVKDAVWLDHSNLALIIGGIYGTIAIGGNIYRYNLDKKTLEPMTHYADNRKQVIKLQVKDQLLIFDAIEYVDPNMERFIRKQEEMPLVKVV